MRKRAAFDARPRRQRRELLERRDELGPAVGIAGVVERVDADDDVASRRALRPSRARATGRSCCAPARRWTGMSCRRRVAILRDGAVADERRAAECAQVDVSSRCRTTPSAARRARAASTSRAWTLAVADRQRVQRRSPRALRDRRGGVRIEPAAEKQRRLALRQTPARLRTPR